jgi:hypothetical protein
LKDTVGGILPPQNTSLRLALEVQESLYAIGLAIPDRPLSLQYEGSGSQIGTAGPCCPQSEGPEDHNVRFPEHLGKSPKAFVETEFASELRAAFDSDACAIGIGYGPDFWKNAIKAIGSDNLEHNAAVAVPRKPVFKESQRGSRPKPQLKVNGTLVGVDAYPCLYRGACLHILWARPEGPERQRQKRRQHRRDNSPGSTSPQRNLHHLLLPSDSSTWHFTRGSTLAH